MLFIDDLKSIFRCQMGERLAQLRFKEGTTGFTFHNTADSVSLLVWKKQHFILHIVVFV